MKIREFKFAFVENMPSNIGDGILYICLPCNVAIHKCACGCGEKTVTPLDPKGWSLIYDGETISLSPSIGNWSYACRSHYFIRKNRVEWARRWPLEEVNKNREMPRKKEKKYFGIFKKK